MEASHPTLRVSLIENLLLTFATPLLRKGGSISASDVWPLRPDDEAGTLTDTLEASWEREKVRAAAACAQPSFTRAWATAFLREFAHVGLAAWGKGLLALAQSRVVLLLLGVIASADASTLSGLGLALAIGLLGVGAALCDAFYWRSTWLYGHRWQVASSGLLFRKALKLRIDSLRQVSTGHVVSLATNDSERFCQMVHHLPHILLFPLDVVVFIFFLYADLGSAAFVGLAVMLAAALVQLVFYARIYGRLRRERSLTTDARLDLTGQVLAGIRVVKLGANEPPFYSRVRAIRATETLQLQAQYRVRGSFEGLIHSKYLALTGVTLLTLWAQGIELTAQRVYSASTLFYLLEMDRAWRFVENAENISDALVSFQRFAAFLLLPEARASVADVAAAAAAATATAGKASPTGVAPTYAEDLASAMTPTASQSDEVSILVSPALSDSVDASCITPVPSIESTPPSPPNPYAVEALAIEASWATGDPTASPPSLAPVLRGVTLRVPRGELCAIVGPVGAGKSSLLMALLGELPLTLGAVTVSGSLSYAPQQSIIFSGSVRENVLFGSPLDEARFASVMDACAFGGELSGDAIVGERGITLSGGQRARLGLARALYRKADVYLLDDPLSALDSSVGRRVFDNAIRGLLKGSSVVLVTHQLHFLRAAGSICVLSGGRGVLQGSYSSLSLQLEALALEVGDTPPSPTPTDYVEGEGSPPPALLGAALTELLRGWKVEEEGGVESALHESQLTATTPLPVATESNTPPTSGGAVAYVEDGGHGAVSRATFMTYATFWAQCGSVRDTVWIISVLAAGAVAFPSLGAYMGVWSGMSPSDQFSPTPAVIYTLLLVATVTLCVTRPVLFATRTVNAGRVLHDDVFRAVLSAPLSFFDSRPAGSVLARFSKDVQVLDERLPLVACDVLLQIGRASGVLALVCAGNPLVLFTVPFLLYAFSRLRAFFVLASRDLKRLEASTRPPILTSFGEALAGLPVVRAFGASARLATLLSERLDANSRALTAFFFVTRWLALRLDLLCVALLTAAAAAAVLARESTSPGAAAMGLSFVTMLLGELDWMVRQSVELENAMLSCERLLAYRDMPVEDIELESGEAAGAGEDAAAVTVLSATPLPPSWPQPSGVTFAHVNVRYPTAAEDAPLALQDVTFTIPAGSKLGCVGRTGAGKSTLIAALLRLTEPERRGGSENGGGDGVCGIVIDGVDTAHVPLARLRRSISTVPQDPILFGGSVRSNLDPFCTATDERCWAALDAVCLAPLFRGAGGLSAPIEESGGNLSVGQRQLLCLARAILRNAPILCVDEATANVDADTDVLIQATLRSAFKDATVITVAHRLATVLDCDAILVLEGGRVVQFGAPAELAGVEGGAFALLLKEAEAARATRGARPANAVKHT